MLTGAVKSSGTIAVSWELPSYSQGVLRGAHVWPALQLTRVVRFIVFMRRASHPAREVASADYSVALAFRRSGRQAQFSLVKPSA